MENKLRDCPVHCLQHEGELQDFLKIYSELKPKKIFEIGTFFGGTLWFFIQNNPNLEKIIVVDMPVPANDERFELMMECRNLWQNWIPEKTEFQNYSGNSHELGLINNVKANNYQNDIDMLHIDGDHTYEGVKQDYYNFKDLVKPGGLIVFHDIVGIDTVAQFWNEIILEYPNNHTVISHDGGWGIGILYVPDENNSFNEKNEQNQDLPKIDFNNAKSLEKMPLTFTQYRQENAIFLSNIFCSPKQNECRNSIFVFKHYLFYLRIFGIDIDELEIYFYELQKDLTMAIDKDILEFIKNKLEPLNLY